jgi:solute carrier family 25 (mitochondrial S-adenosylmethionine transporter), member 26
MRPIVLATLSLALSARAMQTGVTDSMPNLQSSRINNLLPLKAISILSLSAGLLSRPAAAQAAIQAVVPLEVAKVATNLAVATATKSAITVGEEESVLNSFISGASTRVAKELVLHPIDTVRARLQRVPDSTGENVSQDGLFDNLYDGLLPALVGGVPAGALFFGIKDFSKQKLRKLGLGKAESTVLSVMVTNIPYWVVRTPSEVLKTKRQIRYDNGSSINEIMDTMIEQEGGVRQAIQSAYGSYASNFAYALPADIVKFISCKEQSLA